MKRQGISAQEREVMRQVYYFLDHHCNPPLTTDEESEEWWCQTVQEMNEMYNAWKSDPDVHPLMSELLMAILNYIERKAKRVTEETEDVPKS